MKAIKMFILSPKKGVLKQKQRKISLFYLSERYLKVCCIKNQLRVTTS